MIVPVVPDSFGGTLTTCQSAIERLPARTDGAKPARSQAGHPERGAAREDLLRAIDRAFWVTLSRVSSRWTDSLAIVKPATASRSIDAASLGSGLGSRALRGNRHSRCPG